MNDKQHWYGYLEAGAKSSPVLLDRKLDTGNPQTFYLFNLTRKEILEYNRQIVEPKLRELKDKETDLINDLKQIYSEVLHNFTPRVTQPLIVPERAPLAKPKVKKTDDDALDGLPIDDIEEDDAVWDEEDEKS